MKRILDAFGELNWMKQVYLFALCVAMPVALPAQIFATLHSFDYTDGQEPFAALVQATNGDLYGTALVGGANLGYGYGSGTVFKITPSGTLTTLYNFCPQGLPCADGISPYGRLVQAPNGDLYGTTWNASGNIFKITPSGTLAPLYEFCSHFVGGLCTDGENPQAGLVRASDGDFYGTTFYGGVNGVYPGGGTVFKITPSGTLTTLYSFCSQSGCTDGENPASTLVQATNGIFYGTTSGGGACMRGCGTIFKVTQSGTLTTLHSFCAQSGCPDGGVPGALIQATDGAFYGTTENGGANGQGTVFKVTPSGKLTTLHSFCSQGAYPDCTDGYYPSQALIQATDGAFYGTTENGGANGKGTVFKVTPSGKLTTLYSFCSQSGCPDGSIPISLVQDTNGIFYGTTYAGGANDDGTVFSLSVDLGPFLETQTASGAVGATVKILGTGLTGATDVTFNGTSAVFTAEASYITATVPSGATTGTVQVVTPVGTLSSNVPFRVP